MSHCRNCRIFQRFLVQEIISLLALSWHQASPIWIRPTAIAWVLVGAMRRLSRCSFPRRLTTAWRHPVRMWPVCFASMSPLNLHRVFGLMNGDIFHGALKLDYVYGELPRLASVAQLMPHPTLSLNG